MAAPSHHHEHHVRREALTMGLYVSVTLLAALTAAVGDHAEEVEVLAIIWGTTVGLALAHWFAFDLAARLVEPDRGDGALDRLLVAQLGAAAAVAGVTTAAVVVLPEDVELGGARLAAAACIGATTFGELRGVGASRTRAFGAAAVALVIGAAIAGVKEVLGH
jgi:hypothetical protein